MDKLEFYYSGEYATKSPEVINNSNLEEVEVYDRYNNDFMDLNGKSVEKIAEILADVAANGRKITEQEYENIINN